MNDLLRLLLDEENDLGRNDVIPAEGSADIRGFLLRDILEGTKAKSEIGHADIAPLLDPKDMEARMKFFGSSGNSPPLEAPAPEAEPDPKDSGLQGNTILEAMRGASPSPTVKDSAEEEEQRNSRLGFLRNLRSATEGLGNIFVPASAWSTHGAIVDKPEQPYIAEGVRELAAQEEDKLRPSERTMIQEALGIYVPDNVPFSRIQKLFPTLAAKMRLESMQQERATDREARTATANAQIQARSQEAATARNFRQSERLASEAFESAEADKARKARFGDLDRTEALFDRERRDILSSTSRPSLLIKARDAANVALDKLKMGDNPSATQSALLSLVKASGDAGNIAAQEQERFLGMIGAPGLWEKAQMLVTGSYPDSAINRLTKVAEMLKQRADTELAKERSRRARSFYQANQSRLERANKTPRDVEDAFGAMFDEPGASPAAPQGPSSETVEFTEGTKTYSIPAEKIEEFRRAHPDAKESIRGR